MRIIERIPAHYQTQQMGELGQVYSWCPEQVVLECGSCGKRETFKRSSLIAAVVSCECSERCSATVREELIIEKVTEDERIHPWRYWHPEVNTGIPV